MKLKGKYTIPSLVLFLVGFLIAFGYQQSNTFVGVEESDVQEWEQTFYYRQQLIQFEDNNYQLQQEIDALRLDLIRLEENLADQTETMRTSVADKLELQAITGELPIEGPGVFVSLRDSEFMPTKEKIDEYIVHDRHIQKMINELLVAGAEALAINGQRIFADSHIVCIGPVISVDGNQYPAPFVIEAIGDPETLQDSLELSNGIIDLLVNEEIEIEIGKQNLIKMNPRMS